MRLLRTVGYTLLGMICLAVICGSFYYLMDWVKEYYHCNNYVDAFLKIVAGVFIFIGGAFVLAVCFAIGKKLVTLFAGKGEKE